MSTTAGAVEVELDDDVGFLGLAFDRVAVDDLVGHCAPGFGRRWLSEQRVVLVGKADGGAQISGDADVADEDAVVQVALPGRGRVGELAEQDEVGVAGDHPKTHAGQRIRHAVAFGDQRRDAAEGVVGVPQRRAGGGLRDRRQVIRQPDQQHARR